MNSERYLQCLADARTLTGKSASVTSILDYLAEMEIRFGPKLDPILAIEGLVRDAEILKHKMIRMKVMP